MASFNKVVLMGNLTRDPELRYTPSGSAVCEFGLAVNRTWKGKDGQKQEECTFMDCTAWARTAEVIAEYCKKGAPLFVEGRLQLDSWEKDGQKRTKLKVVVEQVQFLGGKVAVASGKAEGSYDAKGNSAPPPAEEQPPQSDNIPF